MRKHLILPAALLAILAACARAPGQEPPTVPETLSGEPVVIREMTGLIVIDASGGGGVARLVENWRTGVSS